MVEFTKDAKAAYVLSSLGRETTALVKMDLEGNVLEEIAASEQCNVGPAPAPRGVLMSASVPSRTESSLVSLQNVGDFRRSACAAPLCPSHRVFGAVQRRPSARNPCGSHVQILSRKVDPLFQSVIIITSKRQRVCSCKGALKFILFPSSLFLRCSGEQVGGVQIDEDTKEVQAVAFNYARLERNFFDKELEGHFPLPQHALHPHESS